MQVAVVLENIALVADRFAADRVARQQRRALDRADFDALAAAGFLRFGVPVKEGGLFERVRGPPRSICEALRRLAHGDSSVALVSARPPAVLSYWLAIDGVTDGARP